MAAIATGITGVNKLKMEFSLLWSIHKNHVVENVENMYRNEAYCDCRLIGAGGFSLDCHKLVISSFSPILKDLIENCQNVDPVNVTLAEVTATELKALVDFVYTGETSLTTETITGFLDLCKILKVPTFELRVVDSGGLINTLANVEPASDDWIVASDEDVAMFDAIDVFSTEDEIQIVEDGENELIILDEGKAKKLLKEPVKIKKQYLKVGLLSRNQTINDRNLDDIRDLGEEHPKRFQCKKCGKEYSHKRTITHHLRRICGQPATHACQFCNYRGKRRFQLKSHLHNKHKKIFPDKKKA